MFGKRSTEEARPNGAGRGTALKAPPPAPLEGAEIATRPQKLDALAPKADLPAVRAEAPAPKAGPKNTAGFEQLKAANASTGDGPVTAIVREQSDYYHATKTTIFNALINTIDLGQLAQLDVKSAGAEIRDIVAELVAIKNVSMSVAEQEHLVQDIINDVLGYGPLEPLLARDDIADIMVNGAGRVFIEVGGKVQLTNVRFRDNAQLMNICQRIVSQVGRRVDESSPICDARLPDGSRVNVIAPPLAIDGATLTIRKFKKDKLTMKDLVGFKSISPEGRPRAGRHRRQPMQRADQRRHRLRQDDAAQHADRVHRPDRARHHLRGRRRTAAAAAARGAPGDPPAEPRRARA
jgi:pilus assembly protein CpaF